MFTAESISKKLKVSANFMVKYSLALLLPLLVAHGVTAATLTSPETSLKQVLGTFELTLNNKSDHCLLQVTNGASNAKVIPLLLNSPCYWISSSETKELLHFSYESADADKTMLVAGTPLDWPTEKKTYQKLPNNTYCTQYLQGVVISRNQVYAVDEKMIAAHCEIGLAIDEKIFYVMAHSSKRYQDKEILSPVLPLDAKTEKPKEAEEKSFLDSVTDTVKGFFSSKTENAK